MKAILTLSFCLPLLLCGQVTITDNFNDGNHFQNPSWIDPDTVFKVNSNLQLQLNDSVAGESLVVLTSAISLNASWEFYLMMDFNPSSSNYSKIYLIADNPDLSSNPKGYFLKAGGTSGDKLSLYRSDGSTEVLLVESAMDYLNQSTVELRIKVSRDSNMLWTLQSDTGAFINPYIHHGSFLDSTYKKASFFGVSAKYTVTRSNRFYFDDLIIQGDTFIDTKAPVLDSVYTFNNRQLILFFDEVLNISDASNPSNYLIAPGIGNPQTVIYDTLRTGIVKLHLGSDLVHGGSYNLQLQNIRDKAGNLNTQSFNFLVDNPPPHLISFAVEDSTSIKLEFNEMMDELSVLDISNYILNNNAVLPVNVTFYNGDTSIILLTFKENFDLRKPQQLFYEKLADRFGNKISGTLNFTRFDPHYGDLLINEIMVDPSPVVGLPPDNLPEAEYLEIFNPNPFTINIYGWILKVGAKEYLLPAQIILPDSFLVICKDEITGEFSSTIPVLGVDMSSLAFTNSGTMVSLISPEGILISSISYTPDWYNDPNKNDGGWSLERIDPYTKCEGGGNWSASINSRGGTPGLLNSVFNIYSDTLAPYFTNISIKSDSSVVLHFSENIESEFLADINNYIISVKIPMDINLLTAVVHPSINDKVELKFDREIDPLNIYTIWLNNYPSDCNGNVMKEDSIVFSRPSVPASGDISINEILFNPYPDGVDFIEIYNNSDRFFDLGKLRLGNWNSALNNIENVRIISEEAVLFAPGDYLALTSDPAILNEHYIVPGFARIFKVKELPSMSDDEGSVAISTSSLEVIDHILYDEDYHLSFISDAEGISLERISWDKETNDPDNWTSTSASAGYATPGYENAQMIIPNLTQTVTVEPQLFHPERESLALNYNFEEQNNVLSISIWSTMGTKLRNIISNKNVGQKGFYTWDGTDDKGLLQQSGIYIVVFDYYNESGKREVIKKTCVVSL